MYNMNHSKTDTNQLYLCRADGDRGLTQPEPIYKTITMGLEIHLELPNKLKLVYQYLKTKYIQLSKEVKTSRGSKTM